MTYKLFLSLFFSLTITQNFIYDSEDWLFIKKSKFINSITEGPFDLFFGTPNGIYTYNFMDKIFYFDYQLNRGLEMDEDILGIHYDNYSNQIWVISKNYIYYKNPIFNSYGIIPVNYDDFDDIIKIGTNNNYLVIETSINKYIYDTFSGNEMDDIDFKAISNVSQNTSIFNSKIEQNLSSFYAENWIVGFSSITDVYGNTEKITVNYKDSENNLWFGTSKGRLLLGYGFSKKLNVIDIGPASEKITSFEKDQNGNWYLARARFRVTGILNHFNYMNESIPFLSIWNEHTNDWNYLYDSDFSGINNPDINYLYMISDQYLALGTMNGLILISIEDPNEYKIIDMSDGLDDSAIFKIQYSDDKLYAMTSETVSVYSMLSETVIQKDLLKENNIINTNVYDIIVDKNILYFSLDRGLFQYNITKRELNKISDLKLYEIHKLDNFIYGSDNFIYEINLNNFSERIIVDFAPRNFELSENYIWLNYGQSLKLINLTTGNEWIYDQNDGLINLEIFDIYDNRNEILLLTNKGLIAYDWKKYHTD